jgi:hypothetical protein
MNAGKIFEALALLYIKGGYKFCNWKYKVSEGLASLAG